MKTIFLTLGMICILFLSTENEAKAQAPASKIQIALLLDTSNSMDGLIDQAKTQLWKIVNELALARYEGEQPILEIALYEYGNQNISAADGYIRQVAELTTDLDKISEDLFALQTYGGDEYCGGVIAMAISELKWSRNNNDLKMIFIAGNEPFDQGEVDYEKSCKTAIEAGVIVNTIFCGAINEGISTFWKNGADLADGKYMNIDQNIQTTYIESPFDAEILKLNNELNNTYIAYGASGTSMQARQIAQDQNAAGSSTEISVQRSVAKSSATYSNAHWDLVDALEEETLSIEDLDEEVLPEELQGKSEAEIIEFVEDKQEERSQIQQQITELNEKRNQYIAQQQQNSSEANTLDNAMLNAVREQAEKKNYIFVH